MKTIKLPVTFNESIEEDIRVYSSVVRYSFNRFQEGLKIKEIYHLCSQKFNIGSHLLNCANREAQSLFKREGNMEFGDSTTPDMVASSIEIARRVGKNYTITLKNLE